MSKVNILKNYSTIQRSGHWHCDSQDAEYFCQHKDLQCYPLIATLPSPCIQCFLNPWQWLICSPVSIILSFQGWCKWNHTFCIGFFTQHNSLGICLVVACPNSSFLLIFFFCWLIFYGMDVPWFVKLFASLNKAVNKHLCAGFCVTIWLHFSGINKCPWSTVAVSRDSYKCSF